MVLKQLWFCSVSAAAFFVTYECTKSLLGAGGALAAPHVAPVTHMLAASLGEIVSPMSSSCPHCPVDLYSSFHSANRASSQDKFLCNPLIILRRFILRKPTAF